MYTTVSDRLRIEFLTWVNAQLRLEIERRRAATQNQPHGFWDVQTKLVAGLSGLSMAILFWLQW